MVHIHECTSRLWLWKRNGKRIKIKRRTRRQGHEGSEATQRYTSVFVTHTGTVELRMGINEWMIWMQILYYFYSTGTAAHVCVVVPIICTQVLCTILLYITFTTGCVSGSTPCTTTHIHTYCTTVPLTTKCIYDYIILKISPKISPKFSHSNTGLFLLLDSDRFG